MVVLYLNSDQMGAGAETLGRELLHTFLAKLVDNQTPVDTVICLNTGVRLTTEEGPALESLRTLAERGARVASCGTCLKYLDRREQLRVGHVGTMDETVEILATAKRIIRP